MKTNKEIAEELKEKIKNYIIINNTTLAKVAKELAEQVENLTSNEDIKNFYDSFKKLLDRDSNNPRRDTIEKLQKYYNYLSPQDRFEFERQVLGDDFVNSRLKYRNQNYFSQ
ncbi:MULTISPECIES: hypothetical protein [unclassified Campylobacter]|uniref:hypothetical protein n=1 Tax=unclassified Campylobacter TaxID=2593542 RepID=UPI001DAAFDEE|nr:hypothetical protein [Campylobacter sp. RM12651]MBZ7984410.1 hypothetical protein [Campylobacter sp. RM12647]ULO02622.1 hypothetical protein AVBRAN_0135 [Campylobacter sp. RM12651]